MPGHKHPLPRDTHNLFILDWIRSRAITQFKSIIWTTHLNLYISKIMANWIKTAQILSVVCRLRDECPGCK